MFQLKRPRIPKRIVSAFMAALLASSQLVFAAPVVSADGGSDTPTTKTIQWSGNGSENANPGCQDGQTSHWHWILTPGGNNTLLSGELDVTYQSGSTTSTAGTFPGGGGNGAMHFNVTRPVPDTVTSASVTFDYTGNGQGNFVLTISDSHCEGEPAPDTGSLKVDKEVNEGNGWVDGNQHGFTWGLDSETPNRAMGSTVADVSVGNHTVTEGAVDGYSFVGWYYTTGQGSCDNPSGTTLPAAFTIVKNQTRRITLCNQKDSTPQPTGSITIKKRAKPTNHEQDFSFTTTGSGLSNFLLDDDGDTTNALSDTKTFSNLQAGEYSVTETPTDGWRLKEIKCDTQTGVQIDQNKLTINLAAGQDVTCTFVNKKKKDQPQPKPATLTIRKDADPSDPQDFHFTTTGGLNPSEFYLDDDNGDDDTLQDRITFTGLQPGEYTVTESEVDGWELDDIDCDDIDDDRVWIDLDKRTLRVELKAGEDVECKFENDKKDGGGGGGPLPTVKGIIKGVKFHDRDSDGKHDTGEPTLSGWTITLYRGGHGAQTDPNNLVATTQTDISGAYLFDDLAAGTYLVCESQQQGWVRTLPSGSDCYELVISFNGQICIANFGNFQPQVLGEVTPPKQPEQPKVQPAAEVKALVDTGSSASVAIFAALSMIGIIGAVTYATKQQ